MIGHWFGWWGYKRRYEECRKSGVATAEELHTIIEFADLRIKELEGQLETMERDTNARLEANGRRICELEQENNAQKASRTRTKSARPENLPPQGHE